MQTTKTVLSFKSPTPKWATTIFRIVFILTGVITFVVAADPAIAEPVKLSLGIYLKAVDMFVWGVTRSIGVTVSRDYNYPEQQNP